MAASPETPKHARKERGEETSTEKRFEVCIKGLGGQGFNRTYFLKKTQITKEDLKWKS